MSDRCLDTQATVVQTPLSGQVFTGCPGPGHLSGQAAVRNCLARCPDMSGHLSGQPNV